MFRKCRQLLFGAMLFAMSALCVTALAQSSGKKELTIGYSVSLTGKFSAEGSEVDRSYRLWAGQMNQRGGIAVKDLGRKLPVKLLRYDDRSDTSSAIRNYERLITRDHVDLLLSPWGSGLNFAVSAVTEKYKYPLVLTSGAADPIYRRGFKYIFATTLLASNYYNALANYLSTVKDQIKTVAIAYENFLFTQSLHASLIPKLKRAGIKVVADEKYPLGAHDFSSMLTKIKDARPDAFLLINIMPSSVYVTRQMAEIGFKPKLYAVNIGPMFENEFLKKLGKLSEHILETGFWHQDLPYPGAMQFYDAFKAKYHKIPSADASAAYIGNQILQQAIEKAGTLNRERINATLHSGKFMTILGPFKYDANGVNKYQPSFITQVQNGKRVVVWPKAVASAPVILPY